jgi:hypothetical protein
MRAIYRNHKLPCLFHWARRCGTWLALDDPSCQRRDGCSVAIAAQFPGRGPRLVALADGCARLDAAFPLGHVGWATPVAHSGP